MGGKESKPETPPEPAAEQPQSSDTTGAVSTDEQVPEQNVDGAVCKAPATSTTSEPDSNPTRTEHNGEQLKKPRKESLENEGTTRRKLPKRASQLFEKVADKFSSTLTRRKTKAKADTDMAHKDMPDTAQKVDDPKTGTQDVNGKDETKKADQPKPRFLTRMALRFLPDWVKSLYYKFLKVFGFYKRVRAFVASLKTQEIIMIVLLACVLVFVAYGIFVFQSHTTAVHMLHAVRSSENSDLRKMIVDTKKVIGKIKTTADEISNGVDGIKKTTDENNRILTDMEKAKKEEEAINQNQSDEEQNESAEQEMPDDLPTSDSENKAGISSVIGNVYDKSKTAMKSGGKILIDHITLIVSCYFYA